jgi:hypothetical protein
MEIIKVPANNIVLSLTSEEASKLYNVTCFVNRASRRKQLGLLIGSSTTKMNLSLQQALFEQGVKPDYDGKM